MLSRVVRGRLLSISIRRSIIEVVDLVKGRNVKAISYAGLKVKHRCVHTQETLQNFSCFLCLTRERETLHKIPWPTGYFARACLRKRSCLYCCFLSTFTKFVEEGHDDRSERATEQWAFNNCCAFDVHVTSHQLWGNSNTKELTTYNFNRLPPPYTIYNIFTASSLVGSPQISPECLVFAGIKISIRKSTPDHDLWRKAREHYQTINWPATNASIKFWIGS